MKAALDGLAGLAGKYDALSRRERVFVAVALLALTAVSIYSLLLGPALGQSQRLSAQIAQQRAELATIARETEQLSATLADPEAALKARLAAAHTGLNDADGQLRELQTSLVPPRQVADLLQRMLARRPGLHLVAMRTLAPVSATESAGGDGAAAPANAGQREAALFRHGFEIAVSGSYADLTAYLTELERLPQRLFWHRAVLRVGQWPTSTLTITVFTLSTDKTWLTV